MQIGFVDLDHQDGRCEFPLHLEAGQKIGVRTYFGRTVDAPLESSFWNEVCIHTLHTQELGYDVHQTLVNILDDAVVIALHVQIDVC